MDERQAFIGEFANNKISFAFQKSKVNEESNKFSYQDLREITNIFCSISFKIFYVCYGVLQFFAIWDGLLNISHHNSIIMLLVSLGLAFTPLVGTCFGIWGAHICWGWNLSHSIIVFIIPYFFVNGPLLMITLFETYKDVKRWRAEEKNIH